VGPFRVEDARTPDALEATDVAQWPLVTITRALVGLRRMSVGAQELAALRHGQQAPLRALPPGRAGEAALVLDAAGHVAAIVEMAPAEAGWRLVRLIADG